MKKTAVLVLLASLLLCCPRALAAPEGYIPAGATQNCFFFGENGYTVEYRYDYKTMLKETIQSYIDNYNAMLGDETYSDVRQSAIISNGCTFYAKGRVKDKTHRRIQADGWGDYAKN